METLIDAGYPHEERYHHCSDLYILGMPTTAQIVNRWYKEHGLNRALFYEEWLGYEAKKPDCGLIDTRIYTCYNVIE